jgi:hypothetical protein
MQKQILEHERVRRVPPHFSWVDHRLVRHHYIEKAGAHSWALYLVLVTVGDEHGLSFYSDKSLCRMLTLSIQVFTTAREQLIRAGVIAYSRPMYQVLDLAEADRP